MPSDKHISNYKKGMKLLNFLMAHIMLQLWKMCQLLSPIKITVFISPMIANTGCPLGEMANVRVNVTGGERGHFHVLDLENTFAYKRDTPNSN